MSPSTCIVLVFVPLLMIWCGAVESAPEPLFGLLSLLAAPSNSSSNILTTLATAKLQAKLTALAVLSDLLTFASNGSLIG